jgi:putative ATP-binding cassette transporter
MVAAMSETVSFRKRAWALIKPYWKSEERWAARGLLMATIALSLGLVYMNVLLTYWRKDFYNSLQNLDKAAFLHNVIRFCYLVAIYLVIAVYNTYLAQMLRIKWRRWMTVQYLGNWLARQNYYRMQMFGNYMDNPDQRIAEDIDQVIQLTLSLILDGLSSVVTLFSFLSLLWVLSGPLDFTVHGVHIHIPGYMVWVAFAYAFLGTWLTFRIGRPLVNLNFERQRYEANFRFSLVRFRENTESIAFYKGEEQEQQNFIGRFTGIVENWWLIMKRQKSLNWFTNGYGLIADIFPIVVVAPRFFAKEIELGDMMQTGTAFGQVQGALSYIINSFNDIAAWKAVVDRLNGFNDAIARAEASREPADGFKRTELQEKRIEATDLTVRLPDKRALLEHVSLSVKPGDTLLITGRSGSGKSTLLRALAGIWPFVEGKLSMPPQACMLFVPQKPYLPLGTLAQALCYPEARGVPEKELQDMLVLCGLGHLSHRLADKEQWPNVLSLGEQQRIAFARVLLTKPDFVFLDEATSALDEQSEMQLYGLLKSHLPSAAVISVGHRSTLRAWNAREMALDNNTVSA